jgi:uncharacterized protein (TIGR02246 family)
MIRWRQYILATKKLNGRTTWEIEYTVAEKHAPLGDTPSERCKGAMSSERDATAVRALYEQLMRGWNTGDAEVFAAPFEEGADFVAFDGTHFKGRHEIVSSHQPLFDKWLKGTRLTGEVRAIRWLSPDVALVHAVGGTIMRNKSRPAPERDSVQTLVAVKRNGDWRLAAFHNTRIRPMGRNAGGTFVWLLSDWLWKLLRS